MHGFEEKFSFENKKRKKKKLSVKVLNSNSVLQEYM